MIEKIKLSLSNKLSSARYQHTLAVAETAARLASKYKMDSQKAYLAGLLHDCARAMSDEQLLQLAKQQQLVTSWVEKQMPMLLHGPVGAYLANRDYGINDKEILGAIRYHTTGRPAMTGLEQLIYVADVVEPSRKFHCVHEMREKVNNTEQLLQATESLLANALIFNINNKSLIHPLSIEALNWMRNKINNSNNIRR